MPRLKIFAPLHYTTVRLLVGEVEVEVTELYHPDCYCYQVTILPGRIPAGKPAALLAVIKAERYTKDDTRRLKYLGNGMITAPSTERRPDGHYTLPIGFVSPSTAHRRRHRAAVRK